jgi:hypothetical protein
MGRSRRKTPGHAQAPAVRGTTAPVLNDRQRAYLLAILKVVEAIEAQMRGLPYRPFQLRPLHGQ